MNKTNAQTVSFFELQSDKALQSLQDLKAQLALEPGVSRLDLLQSKDQSDMFLLVCYSSTSPEVELSDDIRHWRFEALED